MDEQISTGLQARDGKMSVTAFGDALLETRDLDPAYVGLVASDLPEPQLCRWLLAYWCFYHCGAASWLSEQEGDDYWNWMGVAARNENRTIPEEVHGRCGRIVRWPRAAERRHFRGQKCVDAVEWLRHNCPGDPVNGWSPENWVRLLSTSPLTDKSLMSVVQDWPMFGPWIAFKVADMMERCYGAKVSFAPDLCLMYDEPRRALAILEEHHMLQDSRASKADWYNALSRYFSARRAPPALDRPCGPQEVETILCKWKSHVNGHYHIGKDIHDHREALLYWGPTAMKMRHAMPQEVTL